MYVVIAVVTAILTMFAVEGSLIYYRHPAAPTWLRDDKSLQTTISSCFSIGLVAAVFIFGRFLSEFKTQRFGLVEIGITAAVVVGAFVAWRWMKAFERRLDQAERKEGAVPRTAEPVVETLPPGPEPVAPRPKPKSGPDNRKAA